MKLFIDTANISEIKKANDWGVIDGVTTNPSLISKEKKTFKDIIDDILNIIDGPVSVEMSKWSPNVVVKIPMIPEGLRAVKILKSKNIKTNVTLIFSVNQALLAAKAGATYVSPFIGRLDDIDMEIFLKDWAKGQK